jgi:hypothetical protein
MRILTPEEQARVARLSQSELGEIDEALVSNAKPQMAQSRDGGCNNYVFFVESSPMHT